MFEEYVSYEAMDFLKIYREAHEDFAFRSFLRSQYDLELNVACEVLQRAIELEDRIKKGPFLGGGFHLHQEDYPVLLEAAERIREMADPEDLLIFLGRTPCWLYVISKLLNHTKNDVRNIFQINYSGSYNSKCNLISCIKDRERFTKKYNDFLANELVYFGIQEEHDAVKQMMDEKYYIIYKCLSKIVTPEGLDHYLSILRDTIDAGVLQKCRRLIVIDRTFTGSTLKGFIDLLGMAFGQENVNHKLCYLDIGSVGESKRFSFDKCSYEQDYISCLGGLSLPSPLIRLLDEAPLDESLFYYYPPILWSRDPSIYQPHYENPRSLAILHGIIDLILQETDVRGRSGMHSDALQTFMMKNVASVNERMRK